MKKPKMKRFSRLDALFYGMASGIVGMPVRLGYTGSFLADDLARLVDYYKLSEDSNRVYLRTIHELTNRQ